MMKLLLSCCTLFIFVSLSFSQEEMTEVTEFGDNPGNLKMFVHVPATKNDSVKKSLIVALHGCSQGAHSLAARTDFNRMADKYNFAMLYPNQKLTNNPSNCFNWFELKDIEANYGEVKSIYNMIKTAIKKYNIDTDRIFVYGVSAGAALGVSLIANHPEMFKAGAILAGGPHMAAIDKKTAVTVMLKGVDKSPEQWGKLVTTDTTLHRYPKMIVCHGTNDHVVNIKMSSELIEQWTYLHQIDTLPDNFATNYAGANVNRFGYTNDTGEEKVVFYQFLNVGHAIPIDPGDGKKQGGQSGMFAKDIDFYSTYYILQEFGLIKED